MIGGVGARIESVFRFSKSVHSTAQACVSWEGKVLRLWVAGGVHVVLCHAFVKFHVVVSAPTVTVFGDN